MVVPIGVLTGVVSGVAVLWLDRDRIFGGAFILGFPPPAPLLLVGGVLALAAVNATAEEVLWRGVLQYAVPLSGRRARYALQAGSFGVAHWNGIPHGPTGVAAAAAYSTLLYAIYRRWGLTASISVHLLTDAVIFWAVAHHATYAWNTGT